MKPFAAILVAAVLASSATLPHAAELDEQYFALCRMEVSQRYGGEPEIKLVSMRRSGNGVTMKVAVQLGSVEAGKERAEFTTCRISREQLTGSAPTQGHAKSEDETVPGTAQGE